MANELQFIYPCDHVISENKLIYDNIEMKRSSSYNILDTAPASAQVVRIDSIFDENKVYFDNYDYRQSTSKNIIEWINGKGPELNGRYTIKALFVKKIVTSYEAGDCARCKGNGWYASLVEEDGYSLKIVDGQYKLMQGFIKALYTEKEYNDDGQGTNFSNVLGKAIYDQAYLKDQIVSEIMTCAESFKIAQKNAIDNGSELNDDEILADVKVTDIRFDSKETKVYLSIAIINAEGDYVMFGFIV